MTLLVMAIAQCCLKAFYNFKIKRAQKTRHNPFFFQNVQNNETFDVFKMFKNKSLINVYYTKSKRLKSLDCLLCSQYNEIFEIFKMFKNNSWVNVYYTKSKRL